MPSGRAAHIYMACGTMEIQEYKVRASAPVEIGWGDAQNGGTPVTTKRPYGTRTRNRKLHTVMMTNDDLIRHDRLRQLRLAIDALTARRWTDSEWIGWLRHNLGEIADSSSLDDDDDSPQGR